MNVAEGNLPSTFRKKLKWEYKLLWVGRYIFSSPINLTLIYLCIHFYMCFHIHLSVISNRKEASRKKPQYWIGGVENLKPSFQVITASASWLLNSLLICCTMQFDFNFPRRWRKGERRMYPADEAPLRLKSVESSLQRNAQKGL